MELQPLPSRQDGNPANLAPLSTRPVQLHEADPGHKSPPGPSSPSEEAIPTDTDPPKRLSTPRLLLTLTALALSIFLYAMDMTILSNIVPAITADFHSLHHVTWYGSAFFLTTAPFQSAWGKAYRYFPLKLTFLTSILIFELGNLLAGLAPNSPALIAGRAISGMGGAGIVTGVFTIIFIVAPPGKASSCMALLGVTFGCASVLGPLLGGLFTTTTTNIPGLMGGWRLAFFVNLPLGALAASLFSVALKLPSTASPATQEEELSLIQKLLHMDPLGVSAVIAAVACLIIAFENGAASGEWERADTVAMLVVFGVLAIAFVLVEFWQKEQAMIQFRILKQWKIAGNTAIIFFVSAVYMPLLYTLPIYFQSVQDLSAADSGFRTIPLILGVSIFTIIANTSMPKLPWELWLVVGPVTMMVGAVGLYTVGIDTPLPYALAFQGLTGAGIGLVLQVPMMANQRLVASPSDIAGVTGITLFFEQTGNLLITAAVEATFVDGLVQCVTDRAPQIPASLVIQAGATGIRHKFGPDSPLVLDCYMDGLHKTTIIGLVCAVIASLVACIEVSAVLLGRRSK
ncbi:MFS general substrate transporter [Canariomyces notabilis]|uniref:MFS general substrate transporter n=1 Tax=Canariomyces notabilis TaxID=2074819 RepID=A0AAN6YT52_9PEZI|nr:MFS general substrate transporter [Canariomyces arenarius]